MAPASRYITCVVLAALVAGPPGSGGGVEAQRVTRKSDEERRAEYERYDFGYCRVSDVGSYACSLFVVERSMVPPSERLKKTPTVCKGRASAKLSGAQVGAQRRKRHTGSPSLAVLSCDSIFCLRDVVGSKLQDTSCKIQHSISSRVVFSDLR